jgi:hypothetical protein
MRHQSTVKPSDGDTSVQPLLSGFLEDNHSSTAICPITAPNKIHVHHRWLDIDLTVIRSLPRRRRLTVNPVLIEIDQKECAKWPTSLPSSSGSASWYSSLWGISA